MQWWPRDPLVQALALAAIGWVGLVVVFGAIPSPPLPPKVVGWLLIAGSPIRVRKGIRYRGCLRLPFFVPASVKAVRERVEKEGFRDVVVTEDRPKGWSDSDCDYYVEATWGRDEDRAFDRPGVLPLAWEHST